MVIPFLSFIWALAVYYSLGYYLPKRKPLSAHISDVYAYISDFATGPENQWSTDWNVA